MMPHAADSPTGYLHQQSTSQNCRQHTRTAMMVTLQVVHANASAIQSRTLVVEESRNLCRKEVSPKEHLL